jgi:hypothetical protein
VEGFIADIAKTDTTELDHSEFTIMTSHIVLTSVKVAVVVRAAPPVVDVAVASVLITTMDAVTIF